MALCVSLQPQATQGIDLMLNIGLKLESTHPSDEASRQCSLEKSSAHLMEAASAMSPG